MNSNKLIVTYLGDPNEPWMPVKIRSLCVNDIDENNIFLIQNKIKKSFDSLSNQPKRHTYGMLKMEAGIELADLQELMGHSNPSTTLMYGQVSE